MEDPADRVDIKEELEKLSEEELVQEYTFLLSLEE
jgi:hypothetical protein